MRKPTPRCGICQGRIVDGEKTVLVNAKPGELPREAHKRCADIPPCPRCGGPHYICPLRP